MQYWQNHFNNTVVYFINGQLYGKLFHAMTSWSYIPISLTIVRMSYSNRRGSYPLHLNDIHGYLACFVIRIGHEISNRWAISFSVYSHRMHVCIDVIFQVNDCIIYSDKVELQRIDKTPVSNRCLLWEPKCNGPHKLRNFCSLVLLHH